MILWISTFLLVKIFFLVIKINGDVLLRFALIISLLMAANQIAISVLPQPFKGMFTRMNQLFLRGVKRLMTGIVHIVKEIINLVLNW